MKTTLSNSEIILYFGIWIAANAYSLYRLLLAQNDLFDKNLITTKDIETLELQSGWQFIARLKDNSDVEWSTWNHFFKNAWHLLLYHYLVSETLRKLKPGLVPYWYTAFTILYVFANFGIKSLFLVLFQPLLYFLILFIGGKKLLIWTISILLLISVNSLKSYDSFWEYMHESKLENEDFYLIIISLGWIEVRCISFCIDTLEKEQKIGNLKDKITYTPEDPSPPRLIQLLSYSLYLPTLFMGPLILYENFEKSFNEENAVSMPHKLITNVVNIMILLAYSFLLDWSLHYVYFLAMEQNVKFIRMLPTIALCGGGLWMGIQFHMKYVVTYGLSGSFARLDNIEPPPTPRCIARIHLYSQMWKYFDVGLYRFLVKYIYKPILNEITSAGKKANSAHKLFGSLITFFFIFFWHGTNLSILIWSTLNYIGVTLESLGDTASKSAVYAKFKKSVLKTERMEERFKAAICAPLLVISVVSNFYLFAGYDVGTLYMKQLFTEQTLVNKSIAWLCVYSCCNVSAALQNVPSRMSKKFGSWGW